MAPIIYSVGEANCNADDIHKVVGEHLKKILENTKDSIIYLNIEKLVLDAPRSRSRSRSHGRCRSRSKSRSKSRSRSRSHSRARGPKRGFRRHGHGHHFRRGSMSDHHGHTRHHHDHGHHHKYFHSSETEGTSATGPDATAEFENMNGCCRQRGRRGQHGKPRHNCMCGSGAQVSDHRNGDSKETGDVIVIEHEDGNAETEVLEKQLNDMHVNQTP